MITEFLASVLTNIGVWLAGLFPDWEIPAWFTGLDDQVNGLLTITNGMGAWIDFAFAGQLIAAVLLVWGIGFAVRVILKIATVTHLSGGI